MKPASLNLPRRMLLRKYSQSPSSLQVFARPSPTPPSVKPQASERFQRTPNNVHSSLLGASCWADGAAMWACTSYDPWQTVAQQTPVPGNPLHLWTPSHKEQTPKRRVIPGNWGYINGSEPIPEASSPGISIPRCMAAVERVAKTSARPT